LLAIILFTSCGQNATAVDDQDGLFAFTRRQPGGNILPSCPPMIFTGRKPFSEGETKTINYLKEQFMAVGLEPRNGESYFQEVPMVKINGKRCTSDACSIS
jgi:hypothetical protein